MAFLDVFVKALQISDYKWRHKHILPPNSDKEGLIIYSIL